MRRPHDVERLLRFIRIMVLLSITSSIFTIIGVITIIVLMRPGGSR